MKNTFYALLISLVALSYNSNASTFSPAVFSIEATDSMDEAVIPNLEEILDKAEASATPAGRDVLVMARQMITKGDIVVGSCWDYIDAIYNRANFPQRLRATVYKSRLQGPYVDDVLIQEGDWLYFMNHSYNNVEHSSMFVAWSDFAAKQAVMISYAGGNQSKPARYKIYDLSSVYNIMRPVTK